MSASETLSEYYNLAKPGIVYGNALSVVAGYMFALRGDFNLIHFLCMLIGICLIMGSSCVCNNILDRKIDHRMGRTKKRALVTGKISLRSAYIYGAILLGLGSVLLSYTNLLTVLLGLFGFVAYVFLYGYAKRKSKYGTLIGSISGAVPPVVGYCALAGRIDLTAILLFLILVAWQMPHFYGIAMYRQDDYRSAGIPVWPVVEGNRSTKYQIVTYGVLFFASIIAFTALASPGVIFGVIMGAVSAYWLYTMFIGFSVQDDVMWARRVFKQSLFVLLIFCGTLSLQPLIS